MHPRQSRSRGPRPDSASRKPVADLLKGAESCIAANGVVEATTELGANLAEAFQQLEHINRSRLAWSGLGALFAGIIVAN